MEEFVKTRVKVERYRDVERQLREIEKGKEQKGNKREK
jgi:hypothetical protein